MWLVLNSSPLGFLTRKHQNDNSSYTPKDHRHKGSNKFKAGAWPLESSEFFMSVAQEDNRCTLKTGVLLCQLEAGDFICTMS